MRILSKAMIAFGIVMAAGASAFAQDLVLKDRSVLELNLGMWGGSRVSNTAGITGIQTTADLSSFTGNIVYAYGLRENVAVTISAGMLSAGASSNVGLLGTTQQAGTVIPILLGMRYYVPSPEPDARVRPFLSAGIGTYMGFEASSNAGLLVQQDAHSENAFGGRLGAGVDFYVSTHFKFVASAGYNLMADFSAPVAGRRNFNGGDFSLGAGFAF